MPREKNILSAEEKIVETVFPLHFKKKFQKVSGRWNCLCFIFYYSKSKLWFDFSLKIKCRNKAWRDFKKDTAPIQFKFFEL